MYTLYSNGILEKDGEYLPVNEYDPDYQEYVAWVKAGNTPVAADASVYLAKVAQRKLDIEQVKSAYATMITRLEQIQSVTNPTNAQVIQAVKDEALYIERLMKVLKTIIR